MISLGVWCLISSRTGVGDYRSPAATDGMSLQEHLNLGRTKVRSRWSLVPASLGMLALMSGCRFSPSVDWREGLRAYLPLLGHRNWIVVADSAYPAQASPGIQVIYTGEGQIEVLREVLKALDASRHLQPVVHLDAELESVPEGLAPGVGAYRAELKKLLEGRRVAPSELHERLMGRFDIVGKLFRVLILKTDLTVPYTSVFLELDCGYWGPEAEKKLREAMRAEKR